MYTQFHNETHVEIFIDLISFHTILKLFHWCSILFRNTVELIIQLIRKQIHSFRKD